MSERRVLHDCEHIIHQTIEHSFTKKKKKKTVAGIGSAEQVEGLICIASPPERFSITRMHYSYTQVNTQHEFDEGRVSERLFGADV